MRPAVRRTPARHVASGLIATVLVVWGGCGAPEPAKGPPNPARLAIVKAVGELNDKTPIQLRFNPATCECPVYEVRVAKRWVRAEWSNERHARFEALSARLRKSPPARWPIALLVQGTIDAEVRRTRQGLYAVRIEVAEVIGQHGAAAPGAPNGNGTPDEEEPAPAPTATEETVPNPGAAAAPKSAR